MAVVRTVSRGLLRIGVAAALAASLLAGCRESEDRIVIAVLTADGRAALATEPGRSAFVERVAARCPDCVVSPRYDGTTAAAARAAIADGADVLIVQARTAALGEEVVEAAGRVPVVAFEQLVPGAAYVVAYDRSATGAVVAERVGEMVDGSGSALLIDGAVVDTGLDVVEAGLKDGLRDADVEVAAELRATSGTAEEARSWVEEQLRGPRGSRIDAVLAATDEQARGVLEAFESARVRRPWPVVTGVGADLEAVRRVVAGDQTYTVHMPVARTAERAADVALSLVSAAHGRDLEGATELGGVPAFLFEPVVVSSANVTNVVVRDGTYTTQEICSGALARVCERQGIR